MRISDWSSDVCSSDLKGKRKVRPPPHYPRLLLTCSVTSLDRPGVVRIRFSSACIMPPRCSPYRRQRPSGGTRRAAVCGLSLSSAIMARSEEHTSELQSLMRISYAVFCLKQKKPTQHT